MSTNLYRRTNYAVEFPHTVEIVERALVSNSYDNGKVYDWQTISTIHGFVDTPSTSEQLKYHQMDVQVDRALYTPYNVNLERINRIKYEGIVYEIIGDLQDQGGLHEYYRTMLRRLPDGEQPK